MDPLVALARASEELGRRLELVGDSAWDLPTPCTDWDVHFLVAHVVGGNRFAALVLDGMSSAHAIERVMSSPQLGHGPLGNRMSTSEAQTAAFGAAPLDGRIDHP